MLCTYSIGSIYCLSITRDSFLNKMIVDKRAYFPPGVMLEKEAITHRYDIIDTPWTMTSFFFLILFIYYYNDPLYSFLGRWMTRLNGNWIIHSDSPKVNSSNNLFQKTARDSIWGSISIFQVVRLRSFQITRLNSFPDWLSFQSP